MKKGLFRILSGAIALAMSAGLLVGCGEKATDKNENGQTVISVGNWPDKEGPQKEALDARKARFEEENKDVVIEPDLWKFDRRSFYAKAAGGQLPDVYLAGVTEMPEIISTEYSADLSDALKKRGYDGMFNQSFLDIVGGDKILAYPVSTYIMGLAYNTELFKQAGFMSEDGIPKQPQTWDELVEMAVVIKEKTGKAGLCLPTAGNNGGWIFTLIAWSFGVDFMEKGEDGKWKATFNTPECAEVLQWYKNLKWKYDVLPPMTIVDGKEWDTTMGVGNAAMSLGAGMNYSQRVIKYGMVPEHVGMMVIPKGPKRHVTMIGGDVRAVNPEATEDQIDAAVRWLETENSFELTEGYKKTVEETVATQLESNQHVGIRTYSAWSAEAPSLKWYNEYIAEKCNANPNHVKLYNDFVINPTCEIQPEEPVSCQELYKTLDSCIQEVLSNENADCVAVLEKANSDFQINYLDNLTY